MHETRSYLRSLERSRKSRAEVRVRTTFALNGHEWDLHPGVFSPQHSPSTGAAMNLLGLSGEAARPRTGSFLEVGSGTGVIAVSAALAGCDRVVATDISPNAAENTRANALRRGLGSRISARCGNLFSALDPAERFDVIYWHSNYVRAPGGYRPRSLHELAYVDPAYTTHRRFLTEAPRWLAPGGSVLMHFSSRGDLAGLLRLAGERGRNIRMLRYCTIAEGDDEVEHMLLEISPAEQTREQATGPREMEASCVLY